MITSDDKEIIRNNSTLKSETFTLLASKTTKEECSQQVLPIFLQGCLFVFWRGGWGVMLYLGQNKSVSYENENRENIHCCVQSLMVWTT